MENYLKYLISLEINYYDIDVNKFKSFQNKFEYYIKNQKKYLNPLLKEKIWPSHLPNVEKQLEYYLSLEFLNIQKDDIYVDIASCLSLFPSYVEEIIGCKTYRQDILYKDLKNPHLIASDACALPIEKGFFTKMTLHCSLEHFEFDKDTVFFKEAAKVLKKGGQMLIIPFYMGMEFVELTNPDFAPGCRFHRYYNPEAVQKRLYEHVKDEFDFSIYVISNYQEVDKECYCCYGLVLTRK